MSLNRPTLTQLIDRVSADFDARLPGADSRLRRSVLNVIARAHAGTAHGLYGYLDWLARQLMPDTAEAEYLDRWSTIWGVSRKASAPAAGTIAVTGIIGAILPIGSQLQRVDGATFSTSERIVLDATGAANVAITSDLAGADGNTVAATGLTFVSPVSGIDAEAAVAGDVIGGADEESDAALLTRLLTRIRTSPKGGAESDWTAWALQVPGVTRAWAYANWMGPGTVGLTFVYDGRANILPSPAEIAAMEAYIEPLRPVTATPVVFAAMPYPVNVLISSTPDDGTVQAAITAELVDLFAREAAPGGTIYLSRINEAVSLAAGEYDHVIHSPGANVTAPAGSLPMLDAVNFI